MNLRKIVLHSSKTLLVVYAISGGLDINPTLAQQSTTLRVMNWDFYIGHNTIASFQQKYDATVKYTIYSSNEDAFQKIVAAPSQFDVVFPSDYMMSKLAQDQMFKEIDTSNIPNLENVDRAIRDKFESAGWSKYCVPYLRGSTGFALNSRSRAAPELARILGIKTYEPKAIAQKISWTLLGKIASDRNSSEFGTLRNRLIVLNDARQVLGSILLELGKDPNSTAAADLEAATKTLKSVKPLIREFTEDTGKNLMLNGDADLAFAWSGDVLQVQEKIRSWVYGIPEFGSLKFQDGVCLLRGAANATVAERFMNHLLEVGPHVDIVKTTRYMTTNAAARKVIERDDPRLAADIRIDDAEENRLKFSNVLSDEDRTAFQKAFDLAKE
jgi:spermidine/putrescine-binding protein